MKKLVLLLIAVLSISGVAQAVSLNIEVGDQPYYIHGPGYWDQGVYWVWVPGHWNHNHTVFVHGHYRRR
jgi:hypothetical protein